MEEQRKQAPALRRWPALVNAYGNYRRSHRGVAARTIVRDMQLASDFLRFLRSRSRNTATISVTDIDDFVDGLSWRLGRRTVAGLCSSLRCSLRFLRATGRIRLDLASCVVGLRFRVDECPPRALPWKSVRRILHAIPRDERVGRRDYAVFLLMAAYGLGAGEVVRLQLKDVDWREASCVRVGQRLQWSPDGRFFAFRRDGVIVVEVGAQRETKVWDNADCVLAGWVDDEHLLVTAVGVVDVEKAQLAQDFLVATRWRLHVINVRDFRVTDVTREDFESFPEIDIIRPK